MTIPFFLKSIAVGIPVGVTFIDCVGYVARVEGEKNGGKIDIKQLKIIWKFHCKQI